MITALSPAIERLQEELFLAINDLAFAGSNNDSVSREIKMMPELMDMHWNADRSADGSADFGLHLK
jgi:hypothetical protein